MVGLCSQHRRSLSEGGPDEGFRNPLHCILPPSILESIALNGDEDQRAWAVRALGRDQSIRFARVQNAKVRGDGPREGADALAVRTAAKPNRTIRDARGTENVNGEVLRRERQKATGDTAVDEAYDGLGDTFGFYEEVYGRNSIDDAGMPLRRSRALRRATTTTRSGTAQRMVFGDGDGADLQPLHASRRRDRPRAHPRRHRGRGGAGVLRPVRRAQRVDVRRLRLAGRAARSSARPPTEADWLIGDEAARRRASRASRCAR